MSLMNDALRKKNRETTGNPVATGFTDVSQRPRITRRWLVGLTGMILLTTAVLTGTHLMQFTSGNALRLKSPLPGRSQPREDRPVNTPSEIQRPQATITEQTSPNGMQESAGLARSRIAPVPPSSAVDGSAPDTHAGKFASALQPADEKPVSTAVSKTSTSIESPVEPSQREPGSVSRDFEPGPVQTHPREKTRSVVPQQPRSPVQFAPSPAPAVSSETIGERKAGPSVRKTAPSDRDENLFYKKACAYHRSGRLADAIRLYRQVLNSNLNHPGAMLNMAAAYMRQGNYVEADSLLKQLEQSSPRPQGVLLNLAIAAIGMGTSEKALDYLDQATALSDATPWEILFHRAVAFARMNRLPDALVLYREAEMEQPDNPRLQFNLAITCDALGFYPEALAHYEAVLRIQPEPSETDKETIIRRIRTIGRYLNTDQSPAKGQ